MGVSMIDIMGGVGSGITGGVKDIDQLKNSQADREFKKQQTDLAKTQVEEANRQQGIKRGISALPKVGSTVDTYGEDTGEPGVPPPKTGSKKYSQGDFYRDTATAQQRGGEAAAAAKSMDSARTQDYQEKADQILEHYKQLAAAIKSNDPAALEQVQGLLTQHLNLNQTGGQYVTTQSAPGGTILHMVDGKSHQVAQSHFIPDEQKQQILSHALENAMLHDLQFASPDHGKAMLETIQKRRMDESTMGLQGAQAQHATAQAGVAPAQAEYYRAHGRAVEQTAANQGRHMGILENQLEQGRYGPLQQLGVDKTTGEPVWGQGVIRPGAGGGTDFRVVNLPPNVRANKPTFDQSPELRRAIIEELQGVSNKDPKKALNAMAAIEQKYGKANVDAVRGGLGGQGGSGGISDLIDLANKAGPKGAAPAGSAAPAVEAAPANGIKREPIDERKYVREKNPRGGYSYRAPHRGESGKTKTEWNASDQGN